jgi:hypothetical protein
MSDLIERLRAGTGGGKEWMELHKEAADEIEQLRQWKVAYELCRRDLTAERDALRARIEGAPYVEVFEAMNGTGLVYATGGLPREWIGKQVRLVMEDGE